MLHQLRQTVPVRWGVGVTGQTFPVQKDTMQKLTDMTCCTKLNCALDARGHLCPDAYTLYCKAVCYPRFCSLPRSQPIVK